MTPVTPELILEIVRHTFKVNPLHKSRRHKTVVARRVAMALIRQMTPLSFPDIARLFKMDHTSVLYHCERAVSCLTLVADVRAVVLAEAERRKPSRPSWAGVVG